MIKAPRLLLTAACALALAACAPDYDEKAAAAQGEAPAALPASQNELDAVRSALKGTLPDLAPEHVRSTPLPGIYEIQVGMNFGYVTRDGRFLITGDLTDLQTRRELTEDRRKQARAELVSHLGETIEFPATTLPAKYTVTVFTDIDCGYCRMLHKQIKDYNAEGITVRYAFFPRSGPETASFYKAEEVWCSADRKEALTRAKAGQDLHGNKDCANPVMKHLQAAADLGLRGTPAILLSDGEMLPGYHPPAELLQILAKAPGAPAG